MTRKHPPASYPPGYFTELIRAHDWPPKFEPRYAHDDTEWKRRMAGIAAREVAIATGAGWNTGTIVLPNTPKWVRPEMMRTSA